jgi:hypothetical protein
MSVETSTVSNSSAPQKRGRGRPRKYDKETQIQKARENAAKQYEKAKVGRAPSGLSPQELYERMRERSRIWQQKHREFTKECIDKINKLNKLVDNNKMPKDVAEYLKENGVI